MARRKRDDIRPPASPVCYLQEFSPDFHEPRDEQQWRDVKRWRSVEHERLINERLARPEAERERHAAAIADDLNQLDLIRPGMTVGAYWPVRGEADLRPFMTELSGRGVRIALPRIASLREPLTFREWQPAAPLHRGIGGIPYPAGAILLAPDLLIIPVVGFDAACFRLGYGAGLFDRTLKSLSPRPTAIGVGHPSSQLPSLFPQPHDVPMDWIVTGNGAPLRRAPS